MSVDSQRVYNNILNRRRNNSLDMSVDGKRMCHNVLKRRRYKSVDTKKKDYFFPNISLDNVTIDDGDDEYYKPRIRKKKYFSLPYDNIITYRNNSYDNDLTKRRLNQSDGVLSAYNSIHSKDNEYTNVPRIRRKKSNINKYVNKDQYSRYETKSSDALTTNRIIRCNSMDKDYSLLKQRLKKNNNYYEAIRMNNISYNNANEYDYDKNSNHKISRKNSYDIVNKSNDKSQKLICNNCFDIKMLEDQETINTEIDRKEQLTEKFLSENPFYFVDIMKEKEKKRIKDKIENNSNRQKMALDNYKIEIDKPKNRAKEQLQLINEFSLNPLEINDKKDPRYLKQKKLFDKKENIIYQNPNFKGLEPRKAYNDYYNKCIYQVPIIEKVYYRNPVYKENYMKVLKKQIEDKKIKEYEKKKKQKEAELYSIKKINEHDKLASITEREKSKNYYLQFMDDNKQLKYLKERRNNILKEKQRKLVCELEEKNYNRDKNIQMRNLNEKSNIIGTFQKWLDEVDKKKIIKQERKDEENKKWKEYIYNYEIKCMNNNIISCDLCNKPYRKDKFRKYPPQSSEMKNFKIS